MVIFIGVGIHPLSGAWEIVLIERFRVCLQACSCYFQHDTSSRIAQSGYYFPLPAKDLISLSKAACCSGVVM
jgi:hypothetical protein